MAVNKKSMLFVLLITLIQQFYELIVDDDDDDIYGDSIKYAGIGRNVLAKDNYAAITGSGYFSHHANCNQIMYEYIYEGMDDAITQPRNIHFAVPWAENRRKRPRRCKITNENRILCFLNELGEQPKVWETARQNGWNPSSVSRDFKHCLIHFVDLFKDWIGPLNNGQRAAAQVYEYYPTAYCSLDGSMFRRRATNILPAHINRADFYDHKKKHPEALNVQAIATKANYCTHLLTGIPGRMCDSNASRYIAENEWNGSTLVDAGYPNDARFIGPDGTDEHKAARSHIEHLFGANKMDWGMVGGIYRRDSKYHSLAIRASFILGNMKKVFGPNYLDY